METPSLRERNRQVVAHYFEEFWTKGNADVVDEVCSDDFVIYYPLHGRRVGKEAAKKMFAEFKVVSRHRGVCPQNYQTR
jgi:ketosteroid isomerase-like protein